METDCRCQGHTVYRASGDNNSFAVVGSVSEPSFGIWAYAPSLRAPYKVTVTSKGGQERQVSPAVTVVTLRTPPRCDPPGGCLVH
jgi:hypothetical protein